MRIGVSRLVLGTDRRGLTGPRPVPDQARAVARPVVPRASPSAVLPAGFAGRAEFPSLLCPARTGVSLVKATDLVRRRLPCYSAMRRAEAAAPLARAGTETHQLTASFGKGPVVLDETAGGLERQ